MSKFSDLLGGYEHVSAYGDMVIGVDKVGGGTVGKSYTGEHWDIYRRVGDQWEGPERLYVGRPATHMDAADIARESYQLREAL